MKFEICIFLSWRSQQIIKTCKHKIPYFAESRGIMLISLLAGHVGMSAGCCKKPPRASNETREALMVWTPPPSSGDLGPTWDLQAAARHLPQISTHSLTRFTRILMSRWGNIRLNDCAASIEDNLEVAVSVFLYFRAIFSSPPECSLGRQLRPGPERGIMKWLSAPSQAAVTCAGY